MRIKCLLNIMTRKIKTEKLRTNAYNALQKDKHRREEPKFEKNKTYERTIPCAVKCFISLCCKIWT